MSIRQWGYRWSNGDVEAVLFEDGMPDGWEDSPAKCAPKKVGRPKKVKNDNDA